MPEPEDRTVLEKRLADAQASMRERIQRIEREVGSGPEAIRAGARKHPVASVLAAAAAGLLVGKLVFRKRRRTVPGADSPGSVSPDSLSSGPPIRPAAGSGGGLRYLFWITLLQTGMGLFADAAADFIARRADSGRIFGEKARETRQEGAGETQDAAQRAEERPPRS